MSNDALTRVLAELPSDEQLGAEIHSFMADLFPMCRSLTGDGVRDTLAAVARQVPVEVTEIPTGTAILDWQVPPEWTIRDAWIADTSGRRLVDFHESNLHVVSYSQPVHGVFAFADIRARLFTLPDRPSVIPYRTSYWSETWGFCLEHERLADLERAGKLEICIDSRLEPGSLTYGEIVIPGERADEVLLSTHICHPSLANDNLSGIGILTQVAKLLATTKPRYTYRVLMSPGTVGPIAWLAANAEAVARIRHGLVVVSAGDPGPLTYKRSRQGNARIDLAAEQILREGSGGTVRDFEPWGCDERQFCSPGFNLPVGCLMRTPPGEFDVNHTSADDMDFVSPPALGESARKCLEILAVVDGDRFLKSANPYGEPQLGRRGLFRAAGGVGARDQGLPDERALLWVLSLADGVHSLLDITRRSGMEFATIRSAADALERVGLVEEGSLE